MKDLQREILSQVASGQISASEGAARLEALSDESSTPASVLAPPPPAVQPMDVPRAVKVLSVLGSANIVADPSVAVAVASGPHRARTDGDVLIIEHAGLDDGNDTFTFGGARRVVVAGPDLQRRSISIRMNPDLPLFATVQAGNINVVGLRGPITADVQAGNCRVDDFHGPLEINAQAGNVTASGRLTEGDSKIRCEMGSVKLNLVKGSNVRIAARATMGKVAVDGAGTTRSGPGDAVREVSVGSGAASLDVDCTMGSVRIYAE
jgi:hypothetical protein